MKTTPHGAPHPSWESFPWRSCLTVVLFCVLLVAAWLSALWTAVGRAGLSAVRYTRPGVYESHVPIGMMLLYTALTALVLGLFALFPPNGAANRVRFPQLFAALWIAGWLALLSDIRSGFEFFLPHGQVCVHAGCWPRGHQELAIAAPLVLATLALAVMAFAPRQPWYVRAFVPAGVYLTLVLLQNAVWDSHVVPALSVGPPS